jgi:hypothetical protein
MEEGKVNGEKMVVTDQDAAELAEPCISTLSGKGLARYLRQA